MDLHIGAILGYTVIGFMLIIFKLYMCGGLCKNNRRLDGRVAIITGANTGIGKETARDLVRRGCRVILACRNLVLGETAAREVKLEFNRPDLVVVYHLDLASMASIRAFVHCFKTRESRLDLLINNAGVMWCPYAQTLDGLEMQIGVNHFGHFLLTHLLLDMLTTCAPSRVITLTSIAHYMAKIKQDDIHSKLDYSPSDAYAQSKLANVLFTKGLAKRLKGTGVTAYAVHPGVVRTELGRYMDILQKPLVKYLIFPLLQPVIWMLTKSPCQGAQTSIYCATSEELDMEKHSGGYYSDCMEQQPGKQAFDEDLADWLWETSLDQCGLRQRDTKTTKEDDILKRTKERQEVPTLPELSSGDGITAGSASRAN